ncbi:MAG: hypothetical protein QHJ74_17825, partial [Anaerolineae bacterium]|nr:hypothetical protein [Anaerolineae bacterium]
DYDGETGKDSILEYKLSKVVIKVTNKQGQGLQSFLVRVYNAGAGEWGNAWSDANGFTTFWLIEGNYEYTVEKGCYNSGKIPFTVVYSNDYNLVQKATVNVTIKVGDHQGGAYKGYLVRVYKAGGSQIAYQWSNDSGLTTFELDALTNYEYLVEKNGAQSPKKPFTTCVDETLEYKLAKV